MKPVGTGVPATGVQGLFHSTVLHPPFTEELKCGLHQGLGLVPSGYMRPRTQATRSYLGSVFEDVCLRLKTASRVLLGPALQPPLSGVGQATGAASVEWARGAGWGQGAESQGLPSCVLGISSNSQAG